MRNPLGSSTAASPTKPSNAPETGCTRDTGEDRFFIETPETKVKDPLSLMNGIAFLDQTDLAHELAPQRKPPIFSGELRKWGGNATSPAATATASKRTDDLIELPDTFSALDIDLEIA